jgi:hypothetical protein
MPSDELRMKNLPQNSRRFFARSFINLAAEMFDWFEKFLRMISADELSPDRTGLSPPYIVCPSIRSFCACIPDQ